MYFPSHNSMISFAIYLTSDLTSCLEISSFDVNSVRSFNALASDATYSTDVF